MHRRLDFFIVGVQKGGTTALDRYLRSHPNIRMAAVKEVHFFDNDGMDWSTPDYDRLHEHFDWDTDDVVRGEATPIYAFWPRAIQRLHAYEPNCKLIFLLRHPAFRAHSQWKMEFERGNESHTFAEAISAALRITVDRRAERRLFTYLERGYYAHQLKHILSIFPQNQVLVLRTDDLWLDPQAVTARVERFLGLTRKLDIPKATYIPPIDTRHLGLMDQAMLMRITQIFHEDILETGALLGMNFEDWLDAAYVEPMG